MWRALRDPVLPAGAGDAAPAEDGAAGERVLALFFGAAALMHVGLLSLTSLPRNGYHFLPVSVYALPLAAGALRRLPWPGAGAGGAGGGAGVSDGGDLGGQLPLLQPPGQHL